MKYPLKRWKAVALSCLLLAGAAPALAQATDADILQARDAHARRDTQRLAALRASAAAAAHPLAPWVDYWELNNRLGEVTPDEVNAFYERWRGSYVEDRLRNDWLLELGRRRDWANFRVDHPRFRMNDDRQVTCYALLTEHLAGKDVRDAARAEWYAQRDSDDGCALLASTLHAERKLSDADAWQKLRLSIEYGRPRAAKLAGEMLGAPVAGAIDDITDRPARALTRAPATLDRTQAQLAALALGRMAASDPEAVAAQLEERWQRRLPTDLAAWVWAVTAKQSAQKLLPVAHAQFQRAQQLARKADAKIDWTDDMHAWQARAALRAVGAPDRWSTVRAAISAMSAAEQRDPAWVYWKARALLALAAEAPEQRADELRLQARAALVSIANPLHFYGQLAAEDLDLRLALPPAARPVMAPAAWVGTAPTAAGAASVVVAPAAEGPATSASAPAAASAAEPAASTPQPDYSTAASGVGESAVAQAASAPALATPAPAVPAAVAPTASVANAPAVASAVVAVDTVRSHPGLNRAMRLIAIGLRSEGVREWNFSLRGMSDRELIAAAQVACERELWDRCINTSDRTRQEINIGQRYPLAHRAELEGKARAAGLDPAYVFGLVRQESRFVMDARSHVGASGLMQVMPATARWVARKIGLPFTPEMITDRDVNLTLGTAYLKLVLDDFGGSQAMAAAAYNAGPGRPRRWREGPHLETPIWAENIPFPETRNYVKQVLANAAVYSTLLGAPQTPALKPRLGPGVGPREAGAPAADGSLP
jgi:soluble lytic murein transglycosylase